MLHKDSETSSHHPFNPSHYPRCYEASTPWKHAIYTVGTLLILGGILGMGHFYLKHIIQHQPVVLSLMPGSLFMMLLGIFSIFNTIRFRIILNPYSIEYRDAFESKMLTRSHIRNTALVHSTFVIIPTHSSKHPIKISPLFKADEAFNAWFADIPSTSFQRI